MVPFTIWSAGACGRSGRYLTGSPACRRTCRPRRPAQGAVASFLRSLALSAEPRLLMFGPGLEQLDVSLMSVMMQAPHMLPVVGVPRRQINGTYSVLIQHVFTAACSGTGLPEWGEFSPEPYFWRCITAFWQPTDYGPSAATVVL